MPAGVRRGVAPQFAIPVKPPAVSPHESPANDPPEPEHAAAPDPPANVHYSTLFTKPVSAGAVQLMPTTVEDIDQLWDWARTDREGVGAFLGQQHPNSRTFFNQIAILAQHEAKGAAWLRTVRRGDTLIGFVCLDPVKREPLFIGTCHIYIAVSERGSLPELLPAILAEGDQQLPGITLFVHTEREEWATLLKAVGFTSKLLLTRAPVPSTE